MKKTILFCLAFFLLVFPCLPARIATSYKHMSDSYAVTFDGEGDAIVSASLQIQNTQDTAAITILHLKIPGRMTLFDATLESQGNSEKIMKHRLLESEYEAYTILDVYLPHVIKPKEQSTLVLTYKISNYAKKNLLSVYEFNFETIVDNNTDVIDSVRVAVNVIPDLYLQGRSSEVEYRSDTNLAALQKAVVQEAAVPAVYNGRYSRAIQQSDGYIKTSSYLDPDESFHVTGKYAKSEFMLYAGWIFIILPLIFAILLARFMLAKKKPKLIKAKNVLESVKIRPNIFYSKIPIITGLISAAGLTGLFFISKFFVDFIDNKLGYDNEFLAIMLVILVAFLNIVILFGPPIYIGIRYKKFLAGMIAFSTTIVALILIIVIIVLFRAYVLSIFGS
jgi:hypothetical protein